IPSRPISASLGMISVGKCEASSHSITCGAISPSANSRTLRRNCCCSSVNVKSTIPLEVVSFIYTQPKSGLYILHPWNRHIQHHRLSKNYHSERIGQGARKNLNFLLFASGLRSTVRYQPIG